MKKIDVLIVEDSVYSADLNIRQLRKAGYIVQHRLVANRRSMQEALKEKHWDIILSDNSMPGFDALQAIELRNRSAGDVPFIIVSEDISEKDIRKAMELGCCAYVHKADLDMLREYAGKILGSE